MWALNRRASRSAARSATMEPEATKAGADQLRQDQPSEHPLMLLTALPPARDLDRFELKYWVPDQVIGQVLDYVKPHLVLDPYSVKLGVLSQHNTSLYLETPNLDSYWRHVDSSPDRFKLRVRVYGDPPSGKAFFETKRKIKSVIVKTRTAVSMQEMVGLIEGTYESLPPWLSAEDRRNLENFLYLRTALRAEPCVLVRAYRESHCSADPMEDIRVTVDREICFQPARGTDLVGDPKRWIPIDGEEQHEQRGVHAMVELKYPRIAPFWMQSLVARLEMWRVGYSKYIASVQHLLDRPYLDDLSRDAAGGSR
jgi:hypothetical protein